MSSALTDVCNLTPDTLARFLSFYIARTKFEDTGLKLDAVSDFTKIVLSAVQEVEWGATITYGQLAAKIGRPSAVRAVASALGRNPYPFIIPCHRVIASDGSIGGYAWGRELKRALLAHEGAILKIQ